MACLAEDNTKEAIWDAMQKRHTYGVSKDRIEIRMQVDGKLMGDVIEPNPEAKTDAGRDRQRCDRPD